MATYDIVASTSGDLHINNNLELNVPYTLGTQASAHNTKLIIAMIKQSNDTILNAISSLEHRLQKLENTVANILNDIELQIDYHPDIGSVTAEAKKHFLSQTI